MIGRKQLLETAERRIFIAESRHQLDTAKLLRALLDRNNQLETLLKKCKNHCGTVLDIENILEN